MVNEYTPWTETGEIELGYFKRLYLEECAENESIRAKIAFLREGCHRITDEMINAAVDYAEDESVALQGRQGCAWDALNKLNIFRYTAPGCVNGIYTEGNDDGSETHTRPCPDCHGHGWTVKDD